MPKALYKELFKQMSKYEELVKLEPIEIITF
jgi:hypothetical protein